jgi:hypothetical protein
VRFRHANQQSGWIPADNTRRVGDGGGGGGGGGGGVEEVVTAGGRGPW